MFKRIQIKNSIFLEIFGWYGSLAIILAYILISFNFLSSHSASYHILNATGALGIVFSSLSKKDYQSAFLNSVFVVVGLIALIGLVFRG